MISLCRKTFCWCSLKKCWNLHHECHFSHFWQFSTTIFAPTKHRFFFFLWFAFWLIYCDKKYAKFIGNRYFCHDHHLFQVWKKQAIKDHNHNQGQENDNSRKWQFSKFSETFYIFEKSLDLVGFCSSFV